MALKIVRENSYIRFKCTKMKTFWVLADIWESIRLFYLAR